jgi:hypothetical protein
MKKTFITALTRVKIKLLQALIVSIRENLYQLSADKQGEMKKKNLLHDRLPVGHLMEK